MIDYLLTYYRLVFIVDFDNPYVRLFTIFLIVSVIVLIINIFALLMTRIIKFWFYSIKKIS
jgi:hypothetical protein